MVSTACVRANCSNCTLAEQAMRCGPGDSTCGPARAPTGHHDHPISLEGSIVHVRTGIETVRMR